jgi:hypothetical protein
MRFLRLELELSDPELGKPSLKLEKPKPERGKPKL